mgnify:FL=1
MPTFKNNTDSPKYYEAGGKQYYFPPKQEVGVNIWIPYAQLGLELVNAEYPPVHEKLLISGEFNFSNGLKRKFNIVHCEKYKVEIKVLNGSIRLYAGNSRVGVVVSNSYNSVYQWSYAPYLSVLGLVDETSIQMTAEEI